MQDLRYCKFRNFSFYFKIGQFHFNQLVAKSFVVYAIINIYYLPEYRVVF